MLKKFDPHQHEKFYMSWKNKGMQLDGISKENAELLKQFLLDMEIGRNVNPVSKKGARSFGRLRTLKSKLQMLFRLFEENIGKYDVKQFEDKDALEFFNEMRKGKMKSPRYNKVYSSVGTYVKVFKSFWHWYMQTERRKGNNIVDITIDLDGKDEKPKFNYFTIDQLKILCNHAKFEYKILMMFLFDSGIRAPTELMNVKVSDLQWDQKANCYSLQIREETSKTFGRKIKLLLCSELLKDYIKENDLKSNDFLFTKSPPVVNKYFRELGLKYLEIGKPVEREYKYTQIAWVNNGITMYDFRHSSACYWLQRYKSESALKYRFGWKKTDMIYYYSEFLGMKDTIQHDDLIVDITKTELENEISKLKKDLEVTNERNKAEMDELKKAIEKREKFDSILDKLLTNEKIKEIISSEDF